MIVTLNINNVITHVINYAFIYDVITNDVQGVVRARHRKWMRTQLYKQH